MFFFLFLVGFLAADVAFLVPDAVGFEEATVALTVLGTLAEVFFDFDATDLSALAVFLRFFVSAICQPPVSGNFMNGCSAHSPIRLGHTT